MDMNTEARERYLLRDVVAKIPPRVYEKLMPKEKMAVRDQYAFHQGDKCCFCGEFFCNLPPPEVTDLPINGQLFPKGFFDSYMHLHHDHTTGLTLGAVHARCNAVLWEYLGQ